MVSLLLVLAFVFGALVALYTQLPGIISIRWRLGQLDFTVDTWASKPRVHTFSGLGCCGCSVGWYHFSFYYPTVAYVTAQRRAAVLKAATRELPIRECLEAVQDASQETDVVDETTIYQCGRTRRNMQRRPFRPEKGRYSKVGRTDRYKDHCRHMVTC